MCDACERACCCSEPDRLPLPARDASATPSPASAMAGTAAAAAGAAPVIDRAANVEQFVRFLSALLPVVERDKQVMWDTTCAYVCVCVFCMCVARDCAQPNGGCVCRMRTCPPSSPSCSAPQAATSCCRKSMLQFRRLHALFPLCFVAWHGRTVGRPRRCLQTAAALRSRTANGSTGGRSFLGAFSTHQICLILGPWCAPRGLLSIDLEIRNRMRRRAGIARLWPDRHWHDLGPRPSQVIARSQVRAKAGCLRFARVCSKCECV